jgi:predicted DNA-binding antitoxin AbrB/MazE fold protein
MGQRKEEQKMVKAIYTNGVFRPLVPVNLPNGYEVEIDIAQPKPRRFLTDADLAKRDCPFPPEPEWQAEWEKWERQQKK